MCQVLSSSSGHVAFPAQNFVCSITYLSIYLTIIVALTVSHSVSEPVLGIVLCANPQWGVQ